MSSRVAWAARAGLVGGFVGAAEEPEEESFATKVLEKDLERSRTASLLSRGPMAASNIPKAAFQTQCHGFKDD